MNIYLCEKLMPYDIAAITGGHFVGENREILSVTNDSRCVDEHALYVALKGERYDGHDFVLSAFSAGATCAFVDHFDISKLPSGCSVIIVENTIKALGILAGAIKEKINPYTVAVTGSTGKTTTKEFIYAVLHEESDKTEKTEGNFNNDIGMPLTMMKISNECDYLILELGMSMKGEIEYLSKVAKPDIAVITNIGDSHIEYFGSREAIKDAKLEIVKGLKENGKVILNGDEPLLKGIPGAIYVSTTNRDADYYICDIQTHDAVRTTFDIIHNNELINDILIPVIGEHNVFDAALAFAVGVEVGMDVEKIRAGIQNFKNTGMRQNIYKYREYTFIEDCYNAAPLSMKASISVLDMIAKREGTKSIAVLGDMRELGDYSRSLHEEVGEKIANTKIDKLVTFGNDAAFIARGAETNGMPAENITVFRNLDDEYAVGNKVISLMSDGDVILFKASRAVKLERVIDYIKRKLDGTF